MSIFKNISFKIHFIKLGDQILFNNPSFKIFISHIIVFQTYFFIFRMNITLYNDWGYFNEKLKVWDTGMFHAISSGDIDLGTSICRIYGQRLDVSLFFPPFLKFRYLVIHLNYFIPFFFLFIIFCY